MRQRVVVNSYRVDVPFYFDNRSRNPAVPVEVLWLNPQPGAAVIAVVDLRPIAGVQVMGV